jgi:hypothetical protein
MALTVLAYFSSAARYGLLDCCDYSAFAPSVGILFRVNPLIFRGLLRRAFYFRISPARWRQTKTAPRSLGMSRLGSSGRLTANVNN